MANNMFTKFQVAIFLTRARLRRCVLGAEYFCRVLYLVIAVNLEKTRENPYLYPIGRATLSKIRSIILFSTSSKFFTQYKLLWGKKGCLFLSHYIL